MSNRIASGASNARITDDLARAFSQLARMQSNISSGKRLQKPSDAPTEVATAMQGRAVQRRMEQQAASATDALGWLRVTDDTLAAAQNEITRARTAAVQAVNGALSAAERNAVANDIGNFRSAVIQAANATYQGRPIFGGTAALGTSPYAGSTGDYVGGDEGAVHRMVADGVTLRVNTTGPDAFGTYDADNPASGNVFQVLDALATAVRSGSVVDINAAVVSLEAAAGRLSTAQVRVGGTTNQVEEILYRNDTMLLDVKTRLDEVENTDVAEAIIQLKSSEAAYQAALGVTAKVIQPSLLDFLR